MDLEGTLGRACYKFTQDTLNKNINNAEQLRSFLITLVNPFFIKTEKYNVTIEQLLKKVDGLSSHCKFILREWFYLLDLPFFQHLLLLLHSYIDFFFPKDESRCIYAISIFNTLCIFISIFIFIFYKLFLIFIFYFNFV
jgi:hypothetical protein